MMSDTFGVYVIENMVNNKVYIGSTVRNFKERKACHFNSLKRGTHHCKPLQEEFNQYGEASFQFDVLENISDEFEVRQVEQKWLKELNPDYNVKLYVGGVITHTKETKEKIRTAKYKDLPKVEAYTKEGTFLGIYNSQAECTREFNINSIDISRVMSGHMSHTKGYKFKYENEIEFRYKAVVIPRKIKKIPTKKGNNFKGVDFSIRETRINHSRSQFKGILKVYKENKLIGEFLSLMEMNEVLGIRRGSVTDCIAKRRHSVHGYTFEKIARDI